MLIGKKVAHLAGYFACLVGIFHSYRPDYQSGHVTVVKLDPPGFKMLEVQSFPPVYTLCAAY